MKNYQDPATKNIWAYEEDGSQDQLIPKDFILLTQDQANAIVQVSADALDALLPRIDGFIQSIKSGLGGIVAANSLAIRYPLFFAAVSSAQWPDVQALILDAQSKSVINPTQYAAIKSAAAANNIPVSLP